MKEEDGVVEEIRSLLEGSGLKLVELSLGRSRGSASARATVYSPEGTGTDECAKAHRLMRPILEAYFGKEPSLEVMSPGIDRVLRGPGEWRIFRGRWAKALLKADADEGGDWISGRIEEAGDEGVVLATDTGKRSLRFDELAKARLDSTREGD